MSDMSLDEPQEDRKIRLLSQDNERFEISHRMAVQSKFLRTILDGESSGQDSEVPVPHVKAAVLRKIIDFLRYHLDNPPREIEKPLRSANMEEITSQWDANFVDVDQEQLFDLILAANYMDIQSLLDICCAKVASMIKGKTAEAIRKQFSITNDFTPEEEAAIIAENRWAEEN